MNKRPSASETEEDILKLQEEFLRNQSKTSVKVLKSNELASKITNNPTEPKTKQDLNKNQNLVGKVLERQSKPPLDCQNLTFKFSAGFPEVKRRQIKKNGRNGSVFSQQNKKLKNEDLLNIPTQSFIVSGENKNEIHDENVEKLSKMSEQDILEEQNKLKQTLDPKIIEFLKSKRKKTAEPISQDEIMDIDVTYQEPIANIQEIKIPKEIINQSNTWLNFDVVETEKLQWMKDVKIPEHFNVSQYEARFDFQGWLLPFTVGDISEENRILYHHGEEPGRPGYTLKEIFKLCRSTVQQQRIIALNTLSNILSLYFRGVYDKQFEIPLEQIFFVVRISVDENTPAILNSSLKALRHLVYNQIDETCLDALLSYGGLWVTQPILTVDVDTSRDREINDQQLAERDLVACLIRTDILTRIRYIINTIKPNIESITYCLDILIRLIRDSDKILSQIHNCQNLFSSIITNFVPKINKIEELSNNPYGKPLRAAIKFLRVACCRSRQIADDLVKRFKIFDKIMSYFANNIAEGITGIKIQIESFRLIQIIFYYNLGFEYFHDIETFLHQTINYHFQNTNCDAKSSYILQTHLSSAINVISEVSMKDYKLITNFIPLLMQCFAKYCNQTSNLTDFQCGELQIISTLLVTITNILECTLVKNDNFIENLVFGLIISTGFNNITQNIKLGSNLLCPHEPKTSDANLTTVESSIWPVSEHIIPCLNSKSPMLFLCAISNFIQRSNEKIILKFLYHPNIQKYLFLLKNINKYYLTSNWFTKIESLFLINILKSALKVKNNIVDKFLFYELTVKSLSVFNAEHAIEIDFLFKNIVFNKDFFPNELLLDELSLGDETNVIFDILSHLDDIYVCYSNVLCLKKISFNNLTQNRKLTNIIPIDWLFSPIVGLYSYCNDNKQKPTNENEDLFILKHSLQWIFIYEKYFSHLFTVLNITDRFCRISCVFLSSNNLFLEKNINYLLELYLKCLTNSEKFKMLDFDQEIQGLNNFQDFYIQLLEQYQGVSYGDKIFANYVLVPLVQSNNVKWRKILWSEYLGVAQTVILDVNQSFVDVKEFLEPLETDISLINCYKRALASNQLQRSPFFKFVAGYHVENTKK